MHAAWCATQKKLKVVGPYQARTVWGFTTLRYCWIFPRVFASVKSSDNAINGSNKHVKRDAIFILQCLCFCLVINNNRGSANRRGSIRRWIDWIISIFIHHRDEKVAPEAGSLKLDVKARVSLPRPGLDCAKNRRTLLNFDYAPLYGVVNAACLCRCIYSTQSQFGLSTKFDTYAMPSHVLGIVYSKNEIQAFQNHLHGFFLNFSFSRPQRLIPWKQDGLQFSRCFAFNYFQLIYRDIPSTLLSIQTSVNGPLSTCPLFFRGNSCTCKS